MTRCGENTRKVDGQCVPATVACTRGLTLNDDGVCVVTETICGPGTVLDAMNGVCVAQDGVCGEGTAFAEGECRPTESVCESLREEFGTVTFNDATRTCTADQTCRPGDYVLDTETGVCITLPENLIKEATVRDIGGLTDPSFTGGSPTPMVIPAYDPMAAEQERVVFTGTIDPPRDLDNDGEVDQDRDFFSFEGREGQFLKITVEAIGRENAGVGLSILNEEGTWLRRGSLVDPQRSTRQVILPADGTYYVSVTSVTEQLNEASLPQGGRDWTYVGTVEEIPWPDEADFLAQDNFDGQLRVLEDNFASLSDFSQGDVAEFTLDEVAPGIENVYVTLWLKRTMPAADEFAWRFIGQVRLEEGESSDPVVLPSGDLVAVADWDRALGQDTAYEISATRSTNFEDLGAIAADSNTTTNMALLETSTPRFYIAEFQKGQRVSVTWSGASASSSTGSTPFWEVFYQLSGPGGRVFYGPNNEWQAESIDYCCPSFPTRLTFLAPETGRYIIRARNGSTSTDIEDLTLRINSSTLSNCVDLDFDDATPEPSTNRFEGDVLTQDYGEAYPCFTLAADSRLIGTVGFASGGNILFDLWSDEVGLLTVPSNAGRGSGLQLGTGPSTISALEVPAGLYMAVMRNFSTSTDTNAWFLEAEARIPAIEEVEPNDTPTEADATPNPLSFDDLNRGQMVAGDTDVYTVNVAADLAYEETAVFRMTPFNVISARNFTYSCRLLNAMGEELSRSVPSYNDCVIYGRGLLAAETYYFEVRTSSPNPLNYTLENSIERAIIEQELDPNVLRDNGTRAGAEAPDLTEMPVAPLKANSVDVSAKPAILGTLQADGVEADEDWFEFDVPTPLGASEFLEIELMVETRDNLVRSPDVLMEFVDELGANRADPVSGEGRLRVNGLTAGSYFVRLSRENEDIDRSLRYTLRARQVNSEVRLPPAPIQIPDNDPVGITDSLTSTQSTCVIDEFALELDVRHQATKDLTLELTGPDGTTAMLFSKSGGFSDDVIGIFPDTLTSIDDLSIFRGKTAGGDWTLKAVDDSTGWLGFIDRWAVTYTCQ